MTIGSFSFVGGLSRVLHDVPPLHAGRGHSRPAAVHQHRGAEAERFLRRRDRALWPRPIGCCIARRSGSTTPARSCGPTTCCAGGESTAELRSEPARRTQRPRPRTEESRVSRVRLAVIGVGHLGRIHARLARSLPEIELVAVVDPIAAAREAVAAGESDAGRRATHRELIGEIDAAVVATPTSSPPRGRQRTAPPAACTAGRKADHALRRPKPTSWCSRRRSAAACCRWATSSDSIRLLAGRPRRRAAEVHRRGAQSAYTFRSTDVGVVLDLMIHDIDVALSLTQSEVRSDRCHRRQGDRAQRRLGPGAGITFASGAVASLFTSRVHPSLSSGRCKSLAITACCGSISMPRQHA